MSVRLGIIDAIFDLNSASTFDRLHCQSKRLMKPMASVISRSVEPARINVEAAFCAIRAARNRIARWKTSFAS